MQCWWIMIDRIQVSRIGWSEESDVMLIDERVVKNARHIKYW